MPYVVTLISGVQPSKHRGIAFLESDTDDDVDAKRVYDRLAGRQAKQQRDLLSRFDHWLGRNTCDKYFHGWPNDKDRKDCFTFKWKAAGTHHRLYGFLFHPRPVTEPSFQVCVLVSHAQKNTPNTDSSELSVVQRLKGSAEVIQAIKAAFADKTRIGEARNGAGTALDRRKH